MTKDEVPGNFRQAMQQVAREVVQDAVRAAFQDAAREAFQNAAREAVQDAAREAVQDAAREAVHDAAREAMQDPNLLNSVREGARAAFQEAAREALQQSQLNGSRILADHSVVQLSVIHADNRPVTTTVLNVTHQQSGVPNSFGLVRTNLMEQSMISESEQQEYPWDRLMAYVHNSRVGGAELTFPEEELCSTQYRGQKCLDLLHAGEQGDYKLFFTRCRSDNPSIKLVGLDFDDEEIEVADQVGTWVCQNTPRYAFLYRDYRFLQQGSDPDASFFKIWLGRICVYDASTQGYRRFEGAKPRIGRPRCSGSWFYMIVYDENPRLVRVSFDRFEEEVVIPEAADISDFVIDEAQTITYVEHQRQLLQMNHRGIMVQSTSLDLGENVKTIFRVVDDLFVTVNPHSKILVLSDTTVKFSRYVAWMIGRKSHNADEVTEVVPIYTQQIMFLLVCGAKGLHLALTKVYQNTISFVSHVRPQ